MVGVTLAIAGTIALLAATMYAYVALRLVRGRGPTPRALSMFALWWAALAINMGLVGVTYLLGAAGALTFEIQLVDSYLQRLLLAVSMVGLMEYLLFLLTGRDLLLPIVVLYAAFFGLSSAAMFWQTPDGLFVGEWRTDITYAREAPRWIPLVNLGAILLPPVGAALAYFRLFFRVPDNTRKWRIALVSWAIVGWWAVAVWAGQRDALDNGLLQSGHRMLSLLAAYSVLAAYAPPRWAQRRWGVQAPAGVGG